MNNFFSSVLINYCYEKQQDGVTQLKPKNDCVKGRRFVLYFNETVCRDTCCSNGDL